MRCPLIFLLLPLTLAAQKSHVDYNRDVHPILATRCFVCHSGDKRSGGLSLSAYEDVLQGGRSGAAIVPNYAKNSLLMLRVTGENAPRMVAIPPLVAHGYQCLSLRDVILNYYVTEPYSSDDPDEGRIAWDDPRIGFDWTIENI